jgi:hypothetical protein
VGFLYEARPSDSPYVESVTRGVTEGHGSTIRPAEICWHMVLVKYQGQAQLLLTGPLSASGVVDFVEGLELLWIKFKLGAFLPHLPPRQLLDANTPLPEAGSRSFWLNASAWELPDFENADTFVGRLAREGALAFDPLVSAVLQGRRPSVPARTLRHRFERATGLSQGRIRQFERAQQAAARLRQGETILDTVHAEGYFDQPHLTRALKRWVGHTPAQLHRQGQP